MKEWLLKLNILGGGFKTEAFQLMFKPAKIPLNETI